MASTFSDLKIQLMATGENTGTWGEITNTNLGTAIEEAITGSANVAFSSADVTLTLSNVNTTQPARNLRLNLTGTSGGNRNLIIPAIEKVYIINNGLADTVTVKNAAGTGIAVPTGKTMYVYNNGTNVVDAITHLTSLTLGSALPVASGGTGVTTSTGTGNVVLSTSPTLVTPALGTPASGVLTNATGLPIVAGTTGTLSVARGGTGATTSTGSGAVVRATSPTLVTPALGTPASGNLANCTFPTLNQNTTGNATTATRLQTARTIGGVSFNGTANINLPGVNQAGNQNTTGSAATLTTARTIGGVSFNGSANINLPGVNQAGNQNTSGNAATATNQSGGTVNATNFTASGTAQFTSTGAVTVAKGTTAQRPASPQAGDFRFNTQTSEFEGFNGTAFASVGGAGLANDTTTTTDVFPLFASATSGTASSLFTSNAKLLYKPSTGEFKSQALIATNIKADTLSNLAGTQSVPVATVAQGSAKAWVNFNGTGTVAIRASFNVSSITDNGTGDYTVNFTTAMPDADYSVVASSQQTTTTSPLVTWAPRISGLSAGSFIVATPPENSTGGNVVDVVECRCAIFR